MKLTLSQLEQYLSKAAWILKGPVDAADFKVYIFPLLFFKRISDVYDEEFQEAFEESDGDVDYAKSAEFHRFIIPDGCHWNDVRATVEHVGSKIKGAFAQIEKANPDFLSNIFGDAPWTNKDKLSDIGEFLEIKDMKLTSYVSRHSMAMVLQANNVPREVISQTLGHNDLETTNIYLDSFTTWIL